MVKDFLLIGLGGAAGSVLRYASGLLMSNKHFPIATFCVNIIGSFIIGVVFALSIRDEAFSNNWKLFLATGFCGGFTTFSAFSLENMGLLQSGKYSMALLYIVVSILLGIAATFAGYSLFYKN